jgi:CBS domain containing-hemolysin-like protein
MTTSELPPLSAEPAASTLLAFSGVFSEHPVLWCFLLLLLVLVNSFFVAAEVSLLRVHVSQLEDAVEERKKGARRALKLAKHVDPYLAACQIGITLSSIVLGALGEPFITALISPLLLQTGMSLVAVRCIAFVLGVILLTVLHTIIGEQIPRAIGFRKTVGTTIVTSGPLRVFYLICSFPVWLIHNCSNFVLRQVFRIEPVDNRQANTTADDLRLMVEETGRAQEVTETELEILENALELNELCVRDIITPRNDVVVLDVHKTFKENLDLALESKHTRFPLVDGHLDQTMGLIHIKDLLRELQKDSPNLFAAKRDLMHVSEMLPLDELLKLFLSKRAHIALVVDEFGGSLGLVMLDDVLDRVVGEIHDEFDDEEESGFERIDESTFTVQGWVPIHEVEDQVGDLTLEDPDVSTIGGFLTNLLGRIPESGETVPVGIYQATIVESDERTIQEIRFERVALPDEDETSSGAEETVGENQLA